MAEENIFLIIGVIIGVITGSSSLGFLLVKIWKEKPKLDIIVEEAKWYIHHPDANIITFDVSLRIDNKGERNTTIHTVDLAFVHNGTKYNPDLWSPLDIMVIANGSTRKKISYHLPREAMIEGEIKDSTLQIGHTHGNMLIKIPLIKKITWH